MAGVIDELTQVLGFEIKDDGLPQFRSSINSTIGKFGALIAAAISAGAAISAFLNIAASTNSAVKFARSIDIGFEALQKLQVAAKQAGIEAGTLDGFLANLFTGARGVQAGTLSPLVKALERIGVQVTDISGKAKGAQQLLFEAAEVVFNSPNQSRTLAELAEGGVSLQIGELLKLGPARIKAIGEEAAADGLIQSNALGQQAEAFRDSINIISTRLNTLLLENGAAFLKLGEDGSKALLDFARSDSFEELENRFKALSEVIRETIGLDIEQIKRFLDLFPEGLAEDIIKTTLVTRFPRAGIVAAGGLIVADNEKRLKGEEGTVSGSVLDFLSRAGAAFEQSGRARISSQQVVNDAVKTVVLDPFNPNPLGNGEGATNQGGTTNEGGTTNNFEVNIQGTTDPQGLRAVIDSLAAEAANAQAFDDVHSRQIK